MRRRVQTAPGLAAPAFCAAARRGSLSASRSGCISAANEATSEAGYVVSPWALILTRNDCLVWHQLKAVPVDQPRPARGRGGGPRPASVTQPPPSLLPRAHESADRGWVRRGCTAHRRERWPVPGCQPPRRSRASPHGVIPNPKMPPAGLAFLYLKTNFYRVRLCNPAPLSSCTPPSPSTLRGRNS